MPYIDIESKYENTTMKEIRDNDDVLMGYDISPIEGYVLHNTTFDTYEYNPETEELVKLINRGYSPSSCSVKQDYDFDINPDEIYAIKTDSIGEDGIIY